RISDFVGDGRRHATDCSKSILSPRGLFERAYLRQVLKSNYHTRGFAGFGEQRRNTETQAQAQAFGSQAVCFEARTSLASFGRAQRLGDVVADITEENRGFLTVDVLLFAAGNFLSRGIERVNATLKIRGDHA